MILKKNIPRALTVEEPGDIGGGRSFGLAGDCRIFPVESGHVSRRVDQNGRRGCEMRKGAGLDRKKQVMFMFALTELFFVLRHCFIALTTIRLVPSIQDPSFAAS